MRIYLIAIGTLLLAACGGKGRIYERNVDFADAFWHKDSVVAFDFRISDPSIPYHLIANVRNGSNYPYQNLYFEFSLEDSTGHILVNNLKNVILFDPKSGEPFGEGLGDLFDHQVNLLDQYEFPTQGKYRLTMEQFMRMDSLPLILSIGLRVEQQPVD